MHVLLLLACFLTAGSAIFFGVLPKFEKQVTRLCIQSVDPAKFSPQCIKCANSVFPGVVTLCVNGTSIPSNITFQQARCLQQNCLVRGKRSIHEEQFSNISYDLAQLNQTLHGMHHDPQNGHDQIQEIHPHRDGITIVKQEDTVAGPDMLYAEWVQNFDNINEVDKDYENLR
ncbi:hypothetical protein JTE90_007847 [Oedothorax gibbosus]|uniref:Uncharacterized protein n=1 Tax=Oedothorax gibbosus TaxID=931172 RepID=A0AAV6VKA7_9ARAC|nr:hypothetical protein JTE90_007847 [Oedothorax gibbosus]